jgi:hypothetical protein
VPVLQAGTVGILPVGALGAAYFHHLTAGLTRLDDGRVFFVRRSGSSSGAAEGTLRFAAGEGVRPLPAAAFVRPELPVLAAEDRLPEALLVVAGTDQLLGVLDSCVRAVEVVHARGLLSAEAADDAPPLPLVMLASNGIYFLKMRQMFVERLEESTLFGRLPDLWPDLMSRLVGRLLRGVTVQSGLRDGDGPEAIYRPGPPGRTRICGGDARSRRRLADLLAGMGGRFEAVESAPPTRIEFEKAVLNLCYNLLGLREAVGADGRFRQLTLAEIMTTAVEPTARLLAGHVFRIGQAVRAYGADDDFETDVFAGVLQPLATTGGHVPSSLQYVASLVKSGRWTPHIPPTEAWLLDPLVRCGRSAGLDESVAFLEDLRADLLARLGRITHAA